MNRTRTSLLTHSVLYNLTHNPTKRQAIVQQDQPQLQAAITTSVIEHGVHRRVTQATQEPGGSSLGLALTNRCHIT